MKTEKGFAVTAWAPVKVNTTINGVTATLEIITDYPFRNTAQVVVTTDQPTSLELQLRIPQWTNNAVIKGNGIELNPDANSYCTINIQGSTTLTVEFPMKPEIVARPNNLYAVTRGPLVYSLAIGERWEQINKDVPGREFPHCDYEIFATTPWNYGLCLDEKTVADLVFEEVELKEMPFAPQNAPIICKTSGRKVTWELEYGCASPTPSADVIGECEEITLIPYGCTNLRMTEMPLVKKD
jgi:hypothetical protein